ncbi:MAG: methyltransferase [Burkholderiaceae bacterium]
MRHLSLSSVNLAQAERSPWLDMLSVLRDKLLSKPGMYRFALSNPFTRWFTQHRTRQVFDVMAGFVHSQVLLACVRLKLFEKVMKEPKTLQELSQLTHVPEAGLQRLIQSALALNLLEQRSAYRYGLGPLGSVIAMDEGIKAMIEHNNLLYHDMVDPVAILQDSWSGQLNDYWPYAQEQSADAAHRVEHASDAYARYSELMAASQTFVIEEILSSYLFHEHHCVLDVGAGKGRFACALAKKYPSLDVNIFDLPHVTHVSRQLIEQKGLSSRIKVHAGDFTNDVLPESADLVTLVRIAHDHNDDVLLGLLKSIFASLPAGGTLLLAEPMAIEPGEKPHGDAYFHFYLLAMGSGRLRTPSELMHLMKLAGFTHLETVPNAMPVHTRILLGRKSLSVSPS